MAVSETAYKAFKDFLVWLMTALRRPRLSVSYDPAKTRGKLRVTDADDQLACFYHLQIRNAGRVTARVCKGFLEEVEPKVEGSDRLKKPEQLKWANEATFDAIDIESKQTRRLDLLYVFQNEGQLHFFCTEPAVPLGTQRVFPPGRYEIAVRLTAENATSTVERFYLSSDGTWDGVEIKPV